MTNSQNRFICISVILSLFLQSCSTLVVQTSPPQSEAVPIVAPVPKSAAIRVYYVNDLRWTKPQATWVSQNRDLESVAVRVMKSSRNFSSVQVVQLPKDKLSYDLLELDQVTKELAKDAPAPDTDVVIGLYQYSNSKSPDNWLLLPIVVWSLVFVASIGLIPMMVPEHLTLKVTAHDRQGRLLTEFEIEGSANKWVWSPFIFRSDLKKSNDPTLMNQFHENLINAALQRLAQAKAI